VPDGVGRRLAQREHQGIRAGVGPPVPDHDDLHRDGVRVLDLGDRPLHRRGERRRVPVTAPAGHRGERLSGSGAVEPAPQLALLGTSQRATSAGSSLRRWMSARVCRTESWRWAAMSARSVSRTRAARSASSPRHSRSAHGASSSPTRRGPPRSPAPPDAGPRPRAREREREDPGRGERDPGRQPEGTAGCPPGGPAHPALPVGGVDMGPGDDRPGRRHRAREHRGDRQPHPARCTRAAPPSTVRTTPHSSQLPVSPSTCRAAAPVRRRRTSRRPLRAAGPRTVRPPTAAGRRAPRPRARTPPPRRRSGRRARAPAGAPPPRCRPRPRPARRRAGAAAGARRGPSVHPAPAGRHADQGRP
jgi:hypothetical protein